MKLISTAAVAVLAVATVASAQDHSAHQTPAARPAQAATLATPATPAQPAAAGQPATPATPAQPAAPAEPAAAAEPALSPEIQRVEQVLRSVIAQLQSGTVDFSKFDPQLAAALQPQVGGMAPALKNLGTVEKITYQGIGEHGRHQFKVDFGTATTKASSTWFIGFNDKALINGFEFR